MADTQPTDHRYLQVARALRKEIVDGVYPVGSQLPTEHQLCERFSVSRYTVREALRRLRDDNLVASRPRAGTLVVPRPSSDSYVQDVVSINDLLAFATGAQFAIESTGMVRITNELATRTGLASGEEWLAVSGFRRIEGAEFPVCRTEYYINRAFAAVGRLLPRHTGPIFPLDRRPLRVEHRRGSPGDRGGADLAGIGRPTQRRGRQPRARSAPHLQHLGLRGCPGDDQHASRGAFPSLHDDATGPRLISHEMARNKHVEHQTDRWTKGPLGRRAGRRSLCAWLVGARHAGGFAGRGRAAHPAPNCADRRRPAIVDCQRLHAQATALAQAMLSRMPTGSVVSFMLPNWHEAAVIYLAATIAGMVANPILPSLRDRELLFILNDANTRMIFVPSVFGRHDYASMLTRVVAQMDSPPEVVVVRDDARSPATRPSRRCWTAGSRQSGCRRSIPMRCGWSSTRRGRPVGRKAFCTAITRCTR